MLYIIRHGLTDWNKRKKLQGRTDIPLNEEGRAMAENAASRYADIHFDICFCSPLKRARETAEIILGGRDVPIIEDERLCEMSFGIYEGTENYREPGSPVSMLFEKPQCYTASGGAESIEELFARTGSFIKEVIEPALRQDKDILTVGHGAMNSALICQLEHIPVEGLWRSSKEHCKLIKLR